MLGRLRGMFARQGQGQAAEMSRSRAKLFFDEMPDVVYAIGDIHGRLDLLTRMLTVIERDASSESGEKVLVTLGDYVDRGPRSAQVIERLIRLSGETWCKSINLAGNHEDVMLDFLARPSLDHAWLRFGGREALHSYGATELPADPGELKQVLDARIPAQHLTFLENLASLASFPSLCFVHGGVDTTIPLADQRDEVMLWKRPEENPAPAPYLIVHGHTPVNRVMIGEGRVNVDTGAYASDILSAVKIRKSGEIYVVACGLS